MSPRSSASREGDADRRWTCNPRLARPLPLAMERTEPNRTALVVEDEVLFRMEVVDLLIAEGYDAVEAGNAVQALERLDADMSLMVTDIHMPGAMDGLALAHAVADRRPDVAIVVVSARVTPPPAELPDGVGFVGRPFPESRLVAATRRAWGR